MRGACRSAADGGDRRSEALDAHAPKILGWLADKPDLFLGEIVSRLATQGVERSATSLARLLTRHGITHKKKTVIAAEQTRADITIARDEWRERMSALDPSKRVFIDESGFDTKMTRRFGRAARGVPCVGAGSCLEVGGNSPSKSSERFDLRLIKRRGQRSWVRSVCRGFASHRPCAW